MRVTHFFTSAPITLMLLLTAGIYLLMAILLDAIAKKHSRQRREADKD